MTFSLLQKTFLSSIHFVEKVVNFKAKKSLPVESRKASRHALQPIINCNLDDCNQQKQKHDASLVIRLIKQRANIVFVDEACFTSNQIRARYYKKLEMLR